MLTSSQQLLQPISSVSIFATLSTDIGYLTTHVAIQLSKVQYSLTLSFIDYTTAISGNTLLFTSSFHEIRISSLIHLMFLQNKF